jgi:hypothetical protein
MVVYLHEALDRRLASGKLLKHEDIEEAAIEGAVHRLRPKLMTVCGSREPHPDPMGNRSRLRRHVTDCRSDRRRNDHVHHSRADSSARIFCAHEGERAASRDSATKRVARARLNVAISRALPLPHTRCGREKRTHFFSR